MIHELPHCAPGDPLVFVETATNRVHKAGSAIYEQNMKLAQDGHKTPSGAFMCASDAKKKGLDPSGGVPPHQK